MADKAIGDRKLRFDILNSPLCTRIIAELTSCNKDSSEHVLRRCEGSEPEENGRLPHRGRGLPNISDSVYRLAMTTQLRGLTPVITQTRGHFGRILSEVLSPSRPLHSPEFLRGRQEQLDGIEKALYSAGRHVFIHGFRGVGKSSLAQTAAYGMSTGGMDPIVIGCDKNSTFGSAMRDMFDEAVSKNPRIAATITENGLAFGNLGATIGRKITTHEGRIAEPGSINEAVRLTKFLCENFTSNPVVVIDEFDQLQSREEQGNFANFIKQISDRHIPARFIFCGIGESVDAIMAAHGSADRYFHTVKLGQLPYDARNEIIRIAAQRLGIEIDDTTVYRIAKISDGFPHYVHLLSEKLFWRVYEAENEGRVTGDLFQLAMSDASDAMEMKLKQPYETATRKYTNDYESLLWAVADGHELQRSSRDIYASYVRIMKSQELEPLQREKFNARINNLKKPSYAAILSATRQGWYEFSEKVIRGYARLRAEQKDVQLEVDHPALKSKLRSTAGAPSIFRESGF
ncbi:ATP-binding protein [Mesorhizobium sp. M0340]|uniref:ATP-binding protein n=1 Tax=Mesorhizobium sp. M0340 TaxID=2956939 RepID=UPI0033395F83